MFHIVTKLDISADGTLTLTEETKTSVDLETAVGRIGAWAGEMFAVWDWSGSKRPNPAEVKELMRGIAPHRVFVLARGGILFPMDKSLTEHVSAATERERDVRR